LSYSIAARGGQANAAPDFVNMLAQYQMMRFALNSNSLSNFKCKSCKKDATTKRAS